MHNSRSVSVERSQILTDFVSNDEDILWVCGEIPVDAEIFGAVFYGGKTSEVENHEVLSFLS